MSDRSIQPVLARSTALSFQALLVRLVAATLRVQYAAIYQGQTQSLVLDTPVSPTINTQILSLGQHIIAEAEEVCIDSSTKHLSHASELAFLGMPINNQYQPPTDAIIIATSMPHAWSPEQHQVLQTLQQICIESIHFITEDKFSLIQPYLDAPINALLGIIDEKGYLKALNSTWEQYFGYSQLELFVHPLQTHIHHKDIAVTEQALRQLCNTQTTATVEHRFRCRDGSYRWISWHISKLDPALNWCMAIGRDITHQYEAKQAISAFFENSPELLAVCDQHGLIYHVNTSFTRLFTTDAKTIPGSALFEYFDPDDAELARSAFQQFVHRHGSASFESRCHTIDGTYRWIEWNVSPQHETQIVLAVGRDITNRKTNEALFLEAHHELEQRVVERTAALLQSNRKLQQQIEERIRIERNLRDSEQRFRFLAENATDLLSRHDLDGHFLYVSPAYEAILGYLAEECLGRTMCDLMPKHDHALFTGFLHEIEKGSSVATFCHRYIHRDGHIVWFESNLRCIRSTDTQKPLEIHISARDITVRRGIEEALHNERQMLAQRVDERTAELRSAIHELAQAARLKDAFLANMSHELRTPLNAILGFTESLIEEIYGTISERQHGIIQHINESGKHLLALINDVLDLSKIEAGKLTLNLGDVSIEQVCQASLRLIKQSATEKHLRIAYTIESSVTHVRADERRLKQVLVNLLGNAVKFTPEGGAIGLDVRLFAQQGILQLCVWDTGIGIAEEQQERLFQPFIQLDNSLSREYSGTGLGLALVARMVELHSGTISVSSQPGQGSRFSINLPVVERGSEQFTKAETAMLPSIVSETPKTYKPITIMLVEDNEDNLTLLNDYLRRRGFHVVTIRRGDEVIIGVREFTPSLILMDIQIPGIDGLSVMRSIRSDPDFSGLPIIALTALAMYGDEERCLEAGANAYLSKPLSLAHLTATIARFTGMPRVISTSQP